jgi:hypothetical protein
MRSHVSEALSAARFEAEAVILKQDEGIARAKCRGLNDRDGGVARAEASLCGGRGRVYA